MPIPTYRDVLANAIPLRTESTPESLAAARAELIEGMKKYPGALPLGDELVLVLKKLGDIDGAVDLLRELERRFKQLSEETLCRWGSILKLRANQTLASGGIGEALNDFAESERYYGRAYQEYRTFYPRINELTVQFVRASLLKGIGKEHQAAEMVREVEEKASEMLVDATLWPHLKGDDAIWSAASRGEACILLRRWPEAEQAYAEAIRLATGRKFYHDAMRDQIHLVLGPAFGRLSLVFAGGLAVPEVFFALPVG